ncbi:MAG: hypothetical protein ACK58N_10600, partial [Synechocystis sp.]
MPLSLVDNLDPIGHDDPIYEDFLSDLQGNILNGHGRDHAVHIFLQFIPGKTTEVKDWIAELASTKITSAKTQLDASEQYKLHKIDAGLFTHFALSVSGYDYLEVPKSKQPSGTNPQKREAEVTSPSGTQAPFYADSFQGGLKSRQEVLLDPPVDQWENGFQDPIDALIILAADNPADLAAAELEVRQQVKELAIVKAVETGQTLRRKFEATVDGSG